MMLKSMRDASFGGGMLDSKQSEFYREMYDKQLAVDMSQKQGIGLAEVLKRQLGGGIAAPYQELSPQEYLGMPVQVQPAAGRRRRWAAEVAASERATPVSGLLDGSPAETSSRHCGRPPNRPPHSSTWRPKPCWHRPRWKPAGAVT